MQGFTTGEGCFSVNIFKSSHHKLGFQVRVEFELAQRIRDSLLIESVKDYLCCGIVSSYSKGMVKFKCISFTDISSIIIPFFKERACATLWVINVKIFLIFAAQARC